MNHLFKDNTNTSHSQKKYNINLTHIHFVIMTSEYTSQIKAQAVKAK